MLEQAADDALHRGRPGAVELYDAAVGAGTPAWTWPTGGPRPALLAGDLDAALASADQVLTARSRVGDERLVRAVTVAAPRSRTAVCSPAAPSSTGGWPPDPIAGPPSPPYRR